MHASIMSTDAQIFVETDMRVRIDCFTMDFGGADAHNLDRQIDRQIDAHTCTCTCTFPGQFFDIIK